MKIQNILKHHLAKFHDISCLWIIIPTGSMGLENLPTFINELMANVGKYSMTWSIWEI